MTSKQPESHKHFEWSRLTKAHVEIRLHGRILRTGFVDAAMPDSSALWIAADQHGPRQMFEACLGHQVWVTPQEMDGELSYRMTTSHIFGKVQPRPR